MYAILNYLQVNLWSSPSKVGEIRTPNEHFRKEFGILRDICGVGIGQFASLECSALPELLLGRVVHQVPASGKEFCILIGICDVV